MVLKRISKAAIPAGSHPNNVAIASKAVLKIKNINKCNCRIVAKTAVAAETAVAKKEARTTAVAAATTATTRAGTRTELLQIEVKERPPHWSC